jgi:hypothetical protein
VRKCRKGGRKEEKMRKNVEKKEEMRKMKYEGGDWRRKGG